MLRISINFRKLIVSSCLLSSLLFLSSCANKVVSGNYVRDEDFKVINSGGVQSGEIIEIIGSPSIATKNEFGNDKWIYVGRTYITRAFFVPKVINQEVLIIDFDGFGKYSVEKKVNGYIDIEVEKECVETENLEKNIFRQFFDNLGKYNTKQKDKKVR